MEGKSMSNLWLGAEEKFETADGRTIIVKKKGDGYTITNMRELVSASQLQKFKNAGSKMGKQALLNFLIGRGVNQDPAVEGPPADPQVAKKDAEARKAAEAQSLLQDWKARNSK